MLYTVPNVKHLSQMVLKKKIFSSPERKAPGELIDFMSRIAVIWISSPELSYVCHTYAMPICAPMWAENS